MPWNEPGRSSGGGKDPWKGGNGDQPPDLDEVFSNVQQRLKKILGGGDGGKSGKGSGSGGSGSAPSSAGIVVVVGVILAGWVLWNSIHIIDQSERGVVLRFGEYARTLSPGFNLTLPRPIEEVTTVNVSRVRSIESASRMLTGDENLIDLAFAVQYRINEPEKFLFNVAVPEESLAQAADSAMREVVGTNNMDYILEIGRGQIALDTQVLLEEILTRYDPGIEITSFNLQEVRPPSQVRSAFDDVVRAREDQIRFANEAQAYANQVVPEARGRSARVLEEAEGYRESIIAKASGEADRFSSIYAEYARAPEVTRQRLYLETLETVYGRSAKVLMDVSDQNSMIYLPLDRMMGGEGRSSSTMPPPPPLLTPSEPSRATGADPRARTGREGR